jgi:1-deoxy-D-xylulose-5-phosphate reductoisomerase
MKKIVILGSTGSIGTNTLDIIAKFPDKFRAIGLTAGTNGDKLEEQVRTFSPAVVAMSDEAAAERLRARCKGLKTKILSGAEGLAQTAALPDADLVISAIVGGAGLVPTLAAIRAGKCIALANKEPMVMAGRLMQDEARKHGVRIFPVDSEHSALFQSMEGHRVEDIRRLILTASGGPLWGLTKEELRGVTVEQALKHPNWKMGDKITIDSATLMNKGLEVVEARWLFDIPASKIEVVVHRESIIHSLVEYADRSVIAQLGLPDMRTPIAYAMNYPERIPLDLPSLNLAQIGTLTFFDPDHDRFPCLRFGYEALRVGGTMPAALNAANEVAVQAFLDRKLGFLGIAETIRRTMDAHKPVEISTLEDALRADAWARTKAGEIVETLAASPSVVH